ncbi:MAG: flagellar export chaperone FliS [Gemmatimonadota bacterium]|nr:flagellar export chaperone FliS [Gemmatimonadota bacterium]MDH5758203.1 flagellar export chaperone FliS [Gemmatimonadota bacterium]
MTNGYDQARNYREMTVMGSSPERLIPLMYKHLLVNLKKASRQIEAKDIEGKAESLGKAGEIVYELMAALDFDQGGEITVRLASLYAYWIKEINAASRALDAARLGPLAEMVGELHESWEEAVRLVESGEATLPDTTLEGGVRGPTA